MLVGLRRSDCQIYAQSKLDDALLLANKGRFGSAYYIAGYSIEMALKACIAKQFAEHVIPDARFVNAIYSHKFRDLISVAGLAGELKKEEQRKHQFSAYWGLVCEWSPESRYEPADKYSAQLLIQAISCKDDGVFRWIQKYW